MHRGRAAVERASVRLEESLGMLEALEQVTVNDTCEGDGEQLVDDRAELAERDVDIYRAPTAACEVRLERARAEAEVSPSVRGPRRPLKLSDERAHPVGEALARRRTHGWSPSARRAFATRAAVVLSWRRSPGGSARFFRYARTVRGSTPARTATTRSS